MLGHGEQLLLCELGKLSNHEPEKPAAWAHVLGWRTLGLLRLFKACSGSSSISRPTPHALTVAASHAQSVPLCLCRHDARLCSAGRTASRAPRTAQRHSGRARRTWRGIRRRMFRRSPSSRPRAPAQSPSAERRALLRWPGHRPSPGVDGASG